jgi:hypothetical protein
MISDGKTIEHYYYLKSQYYSGNQYYSEINTTKHLEKFIVVNSFLKINMGSYPANTIFHE